MQIRKFYCHSIREGLLQIKRELGPEAVILHSRKVRQRGVRGLFMHPVLEIIAALDRAPDSSLPAPGTGSAPEPDRFPADSVAAELKELKSLIRGSLLRGAAAEGEPPPATAPGETFRFWRALLERHDVDPALAGRIIAAIEKSMPDPGALTPEALTLQLTRETVRCAPCCPEKSCRIQVLVGPTGVGKTTTVAKLAARYSLFQKEKVGLITVDHYRVGAVEQIGTYAEIIGLPCEAVLTPQELPGALNRLEGCARILVDTAGSATGNQGQIEDLAAYVKLLLPAEVSLVLSATTRRQDLRLIADSFSVLHYNRLIVTKMDETGSFGALLNAPHYTGCPLLYLTDGQKVPEDLQPARDVDLAALLFPGGGEESCPIKLKSCGSMPG